jgi:hypothetical protein
VRGPVQLWARPAAVIDALALGTWCGRRWGSQGTRSGGARQPRMRLRSNQRKRLVVAPLVVEQAESVTGCGEIDMAEISSLFTARSSLSMAAASARVAP